MSNQEKHQKTRSVTEPDRPSDIDRMDDQLKYDIQPDQDIQPDEGSPRSPEEKQIGDRSQSGSERVQHPAGNNAEDHSGGDVTEAPEEA